MTKDNALKNASGPWTARTEINTATELYSIVCEEHDAIVQWVTEAIVKGASPNKLTPDRRQRPKTP